MTANMKPQGGRSIGPRRSAAYRAAPRQAKTVKQLKRKCRGGAGCRENISGFRLREKCFSLDIPFDRTWGQMPAAYAKNSKKLELLPVLPGIPRPNSGYCR